MTDSRARRLNIWMPLLFAAILCFGMTLGFRLRDTLRNKRDIDALVERNDRLEEIIDLINERYVDSVNSDALYSDAVAGILSHLDPHTAYIPASDVAEANEDLEGSFFGIGVEFSIVRDTIRITQVIEGGPAERAGVGVGDKLVRVNDSLVAGTGITSDRIVTMLRGEQFSRATVTLADGTSGRAKQLVIVRGAVPIASVEAALMLDGETGFIKINRFAATTHQEFIRALRKLQKQGMKALVLDLRQNPGGFLDQAVSIADEFLDGDKTIVVTRGRFDSHTDAAQYPGLFERGRLAVLVDESSASASEILAGAVQDWDRGIVVGRPSFGKGLVQEQYDLGDGSVLRLTVARYYTPSGRCVQRSYAGGKSAYEAAFEHRFETGELTGQDTTAFEDTATYYTAAHRPVHGGGGIRPDLYMPYDTALLNGALLDLAYGDVVGVAIYDYYITNAATLRAYPSPAAFLQGMGDGNGLLTFTLGRLPAAEQAAAVRLLTRPALYSFFRTQLLARLARILYRSTGYYTVALRDDLLVRRALEAVRSSQYSTLIHR